MTNKALNTVDIPQDSTNFPACKHFWRFNETDIGNEALVDVMGGANIAAADWRGATRPDDYSLDFAIGSGIHLGATPVASLSQPGTKHFAVMAVGIFGTTGDVVKFGDLAATGGVRLKHLTSGTIFDGTTTTSASTGFTSAFGETIGRMIAVDGTNMYLLEAGIDANATVTTPTLRETKVKGIGSMAFADKIFVLSANTGMYGLAMFEWTALPSTADLLNALGWMTGRWAAGDKSIYPGWRNRNS